MPYYLWDVKNRHCIVVSREWREPVEYTAISHTWGRWKIHGYVQIEGIEGWLIPRNKRFDVAKLPDYLADVGLRYPMSGLIFFASPKSLKVTG
jgi:hypothetical protein